MEPSPGQLGAQQAVLGELLRMRQERKREKENEAERSCVGGHRAKEPSTGLRAYHVDTLARWTAPCVLVLKALEVPGLPVWSPTLPWKAVES